MIVRNVALLGMVLLAIVHSSHVFPQTYRIKTATLNNGSAVYTDVFEYDYVDDQPEFPGGSSQMIKFINNTRQYPEEAYELGIEGRVTCSFIVHPDGKISHIQVLKGVESSLNQEAMRIVSMMPDWIPGRKNDKPVAVRVICGIPFRR